jgi:hypothetical protein
MAICIAVFRTGKKAPPSKNRVGGSPRPSSFRAPENRLQLPESHRVLRPDATTTASGRSVWPSRDPIGENGGGNLYNHVNNNSVNLIDLLGHIVAEISFKFNLERPPGTTNDLSGLTTLLKWEMLHLGPPVSCGPTGGEESKVYAEWYMPSLVLEVSIYDTAKPDPEAFLHEMKHVKYYEQYATEVESAVDALMYKCLCKPCYFANLEYLSALDTYMQAENQLANLQWDYDEYGHRSPIHGPPLLNAILSTKNIIFVYAQILEGAALKKQLACGLAQ